MPAWSGRLDSDEIESVAEYVFKQVGAGWAEAGLVGRLLRCVGQVLRVWRSTSVQAGGWGK